MSGTTQVRAGVRPLRWWEGVGSPGPVGYVLADAASAAALALIVTAVGIAGAGGTAPGEAVGAFVVVLGFALACSVPFALVGCTLVHLCCRDVRAQSVHVLAAAAAGAVALPVASLLLGGTAEWGWYCVALGLATATGRAAVVPLARRRTRSRR